MATAVCLTTFAQVRSYGDWQVGKLANDAGLHASTTNDSGATFGMACFVEMNGCQWMLVNNIGCSDGDKYTALINSDSGARSMQVTCTKVGARRGYIFSDFPAIESLVKNSAKIGFAMPMENGMFRVNRFSLDGSVKALDFMRIAFDLLLKRGPSEAGDTRDMQI